MVPWTAGAGRSTQRAASLEVELQALDASDEGEEFMPYCVMPHVERLLQVCSYPVYKVTLCATFNMLHSAVGTKPGRCST